MTDKQEVMRQCWDGERERECRYCPANGDCCFGHRYEYGDPPCMSCPHRDDCSVLTRQAQQEERQSAAGAPRRIILNRNQPQPSRAASAARPTVVHSTVSRPVNDGVLHHGRGSEPVPLEIPEGTSFIRQVGLHAAWGAVEGMLELLLVFFRRRRPE